MSRAEVRDYFAKIGKWMRQDIQREIDLERVTRTPEGRAKLTELGVCTGGGNVLAALGLVAYTEALGALRVWNQRGRQYGSAEDRFNAFFDRMKSGEYRAWWSQWPGRQGKSAYVVLRNGLVHEYQPKVNAELHIGEAEALGFDEEDGVLIFRVEPYFRHFEAEMGALERELLAMRDPEAEVRPPSGMPRGAVMGQSLMGTVSVASRGAYGSVPSIEPTSGSPTVKRTSLPDDDVG